MAEGTIRLRLLEPGGSRADHDAARDVARALERAGVPADTGGVAPEQGSKGALLDGLTLSAAMPLLVKAMEVVAGYFKRPDVPPTEIELELPGSGKLRVKFDPRTMEPGRVPALVQALSSAMGAPRAP